MAAGVELDRCATGHEMLHRQSEKQSFPSTTQNWIAFGGLVATYNFAASLFCVHNLYFVAVLDDGSWKLAVLHSLLCCTDLVSNGQNCKHSLEEQ